MPAEAVDLSTVLQQIHDRATHAADGTPDAMRAALRDVAELASSHTGDTPEPSDVPQTENQSL